MTTRTTSRSSRPGASSLATVSLGDSSSVRVGQSVVTIGNTGGVGGTPSAADGSIVALNQSITAGDEFDGAVGGHHGQITHTRPGS
jgi:S1-C subfamily serine protease